MCNSCDCKCKETAPIKLEVGKTYITDKKTKVRILCNDRKDSLCMVYAYTSFPYGGGEGIAMHEDDGYIFHGEGRQKIVSEYKEPEYWYVNVYKTPMKDVARGLTTYSTQLFANSSVYNNTRIALVRINRETGVAENVPIN